MTREKSEFGKGLVICLVKFAQHRTQHNADSFGIFDKWIKQNPENRKLMLSPSPPDNLNYGFPHMQRLKHFVEIADKIYEGDYEKYLSKEIETFMNGASDHLYEIEVPKDKRWDKVRKMVEKLRKKALHMGHGFEEKKKWTLKDVEDLFELINKISVEIDKNLGLKAEIGQHS